MIVNLTPHVVVVLPLSGEGQGRAIPPSGTAARVSMSTVPAGTADELEVTRQVPGAIVGLPDECEGVWLLVSALVRLALPGRPDLLSPGELVRGPDGQPIGCRGLVRS